MREGLECQRGGRMECRLRISVLWEVEERQEGLVEEGILGQLESILRGFKTPE